MKKTLNAMAPWLAAMLLAAFLAACGGGGGGRDPILGFDAPPAPPTGTAVAPLNGATGVAINNAVISADFSERMQPPAGPAPFLLPGPALSTSPTGPPTPDPSTRIAPFPLTAGTQLTPLTLYTATVAGARSS